MAAYKRVTITAANVHDGLGGVHLRGQTPVLPLDIANLFIERKLAIEDTTLTDEEAKAEALRLQDEVRQREQKERAEAVMKRHDRLPEEDRLKAHDPQPEPEHEQEIPFVPTPKKRGRPRKEA